MYAGNTIQIVKVENKKQLKDFIYLPQMLHKSHSKWVPPIYRDEWKYFNPKKNLAFTYCDVEMILCFLNKRPAGRVMGIINHRYNSMKNEKSARFSHFECIDDLSVSSSLLRHVENWAKEKGMNHLIGPFGMCYHDPIGFMIEGSENEPSISTYYNFDFIPLLVERNGYKKKYDLVAYKINLKNDPPDFYQSIHERVLNNKNVRLLILNSKKDLKKKVIPLLKLLNECYTEIDGYSPLDENEMLDLARQYIPVLDPKFVKLVYVNDEPAGFTVAMPNISQGIRNSGGRLFPFGFFKIMKAFNHAEQLDLLLGGIKLKYQGIGIDVLMGYDIIRTAKQKRFKLLDSHLEMENNFKVRAEMEKLGGQVYKKYRLYEKKI